MYRKNYKYISTMFLPTLHLNSEMPKLYHRSIVLGDTSPARANRLRLERRLFSCTGACNPVLSTSSGKSFMDLQVNSLLDGIVLEDRVMKSAVAAIVRHSPTKFTIFSAHPAYSNQPSHQGLYVYAEVKQGDNCLHVITEQESSSSSSAAAKPTFTIHKLANGNC